MPGSQVSVPAGRKQSTTGYEIFARCNVYRALYVTTVSRNELPYQIGTIVFSGKGSYMGNIVLFCRSNIRYVSKVSAVIGPVKCVSMFVLLLILCIFGDYQ